jgi:2-dehydro-3-deoxygluconokinase
MSVLAPKAPSACRYDVVSLGEVMLRLDPGPGRVATARSFAVSEGGGEYNVARGAKRCFGLRSGIVTALADNAVGRLIEDLIYQGGVEQVHLDWRPYDGVGRDVRNGLNFTERGFGVRAPAGCSDRGHTAASQMRPGDVDWERLFGEDGVRWFHTGGIFCALSSDTAALAAQAMQTARRHGTIVSYDVNFRPSLWKAASTAPQEVNRALIEHVDVLLGNEEDFSAGLGYTIEGVDQHMLELDAGAYERLLAAVMADNPQLAVAATTLRQARTATVNDWTAVCRTRTAFVAGTQLNGLEIFDRIGGGDSFASGLLYGLLGGMEIDRALSYGIAHGALAMTTPGDTSMATLGDVERLVGGGAARVIR